MPTNLPERNRKSPEDWDEEKIIPILLWAAFVIAGVILLWRYAG
jgi:hypothetical protein